VSTLERVGFGRDEETALSAVFDGLRAEFFSGSVEIDGSRRGRVVMRFGTIKTVLLDDDTDSTISVRDRLAYLLESPSGTFVIERTPTKPGAAVLHHAPPADEVPFAVEREHLRSAAPVLPVTITPTTIISPPPSSVPVSSEDAAPARREATARVGSLRRLIASLKRS
jgi:hypothetical protein